MTKKSVVVTGIGPIGSPGIGKERFWQGILDHRTNVVAEECVLDGEMWGSFPVHKVDGFDIHGFGLDEDKLRDIKDWKEGEENRDLNYLLAAVKLALDDSRIDYHQEHNGIGLVLAHENIGLMPFGFKVSELAYEMLIGKTKKDISKKAFFEGFYKNFIKSGYDIQTFVNLYHVARVFNVHDYSLFINNACASGLYALEAAAQIIQSGQAKAVVIAASDHPDMYKYLWFRDLGIYAADGVIKPFSSESNGLVFGDGGAAVVMESREHAEQRGADIYAEYLGGGFDLEGWKVTVPQIGGRSYHHAIRKALDNAGVKNSDVELVVPHGVGSKPIDYYEAKAITDTFGNTPLITTFKPYVGHNLGSSALLEATILLLALKHGIIPETLHSQKTDPRYAMSLLTAMVRKRVKIAIKATCAFAGFNAATVFKGE